jgi:hypothetical protein
MAESSTSGVVAYVLQPIAQFLFGCLISKVKRMNESKLICLVVPASSGKSTFVRSYMDEFNSINNDLYIIDLEEACLKDLDDRSKKELFDLKTKDILIFQSKLFLLAESYLRDIIAHLKQTKQKKRLVVLVSSVELKKFLNVPKKSTFYYAPSKKLYESILEKNKLFKPYLDYTRTLLEPKLKTFVYSTFNELTERILKDLKIERTI